MRLREIPTYRSTWRAWKAWKTLERRTNTSAGKSESRTRARPTSCSPSPPQVLGGPWDRTSPAETSNTQAHTSGRGGAKGCVGGSLQEVLEDRPGLVVQEDPALPPPLCCPRRPDPSCLVSPPASAGIPVLLLGDAATLAVNSES